MENIIIFGSGRIGKKTISYIEQANAFNIVEIWDNNPDIWETKYQNKYRIVSPRSEIDGIDKILICTVYEEPIMQQLITELGIDAASVKQQMYCFEPYREQIIEKYKNDREDVELVEVISYLQDNNLKVYNYAFTEEYRSENEKVELDFENSLYYTYWNGKKLYFNRKFTDKLQAARYVSALKMEQDPKSPHYYYDANYAVSENDIVIDAGAAEGFWALSVIDKVKKVYLVEGDNDWIEALQYTFAPYKDKVTIIQKMLTNNNDEKNITIDKIAELAGKVNYIKMDIEGGEIEALHGAEKTLEQRKERLTVLACAYHNEMDGANISALMKDKGARIEYSKGYMFFPYGEEIKPELRRGLVRAKFDN